MLEQNTGKSLDPVHAFIGVKLAEQSEKLLSSGLRPAIGLGTVGLAESLTDAETGTHGLKPFTKVLGTLIGSKHTGNAKNTTSSLQEQMPAEFGRKTYLESVTSNDPATVTVETDHSLVVVPSLPYDEGKRGHLWLRTSP